MIVNQEAQTAVDLWHSDADPDEFIAARVLLRDAVRKEWPALGAHLDSAPPSDIIDWADPPEEYKPAAAISPSHEGTDSSETVTMRWPQLAGVAFAFAAGLGVGMVVQLAVIAALRGW